VQQVEAMRMVPVILRHGRRERRDVITGLNADSQLYRALDADHQPIALDVNGGVVLSSAVADLLDVEAGQFIEVEVREGRKPVLQLPVSGIAETLLGAPIFMERSALNRALKEPGRASNAYLRVDVAQLDALQRALGGLPNIAGVSIKAHARDMFLKVMNEGAGAIRYLFGGFAFIITFGIIYNAARIAYAERERDLASLRVIGFHRSEATYVLLGELIVVVLLALPIGALFGYGMTFLVAAAFSNEIYQVPVIFVPGDYGMAILLVIAATLASSLMVKRDLDHIQLVSALKTRD
jgi:putative ABC transport system permease protein